MSRAKKYLLYDFLQVAGGAERLSLTLIEGIPDMELVVARLYPEAAALGRGSLSAKVLADWRTAILGHIPEAIAVFMTRTHFLKDAYQVIYSGYYAPLAVRNQHTGRKLFYCHTPPRFAYDQKAESLAQMPHLSRLVYSVAIDRYRKLYEQSMKAMDMRIANSVNVQRRLKNYLGLDSEVVYPPIDTETFRWLESGEYFLSTARLTPHKRVDLIVRAFLDMPDEKLVVVSGGPELDRLRRLADGADNIHFTGWQSEDRLKDWIGRARAVVYVPIEEDFGMSPVEAMAAGKPVIGVAEGGLLETVIDGQTGLLLAPPPTPAAIVEAVKRLDRQRATAMRAACEEQAARFGRTVFIDKMNQFNTRPL